jgi:hypothetical protein
MPKIKHTATHNGQTFLRTSASRTYSHVVVARPSYDHAFAGASSAGQRKQDVQNFSFHIGYVNGTSQFLARASYECDDAKFEARVANDIARAIERLGGTTTAEAYADLCAARRVAAVEKQMAEGYYDTFVSMGWASRADLAAKLHASTQGPMWAEVVTLPAVVG